MKHFSYIRTLGATVMLVCLALSGYVRGDASTEAPDAGTQHFLAPEEITSADYAMMSDYAYRYDDCLNQTSQKQMDKQPDPRHVVDYAMKLCAAELEELDRKMIARNFDPAYRQGFIGKVNRQAVNNTLRNVMMGMAARQTQSPDSAQ